MGRKKFKKTVKQILSERVAKKTTKNWPTSFLSPNVKRGYLRFVVSKIVAETPLAYKLLVKEKESWYPKSKIKLGIHPSGYFYAVDMPIKYADDRGYIDESNSYLIHGVIE